MTLTLVITLIFGFTAIAVAATSVANAVSVRLNELYQQVKPSNEEGKHTRPKFRFLYGDDRGQALRTELADTPRVFATAAIASIIVLTTMHLVLSALTDEPGILTAQGAITLFAVGSYACRVLYVVASYSTDLHKIMQDAIEAP